MSTRTRQDWILWAQLGCALVATAHAEYTLVTALDQNWAVAGAVTGALDLYVVRALQKHKDVLPAVLVMVAANVASILISAGVLDVSWGVLACVGALSPLLVWRGHRLRVHASVGADAVSAPVLEDECTPDTVECGAPDVVPDWMHEECPPSAPALLHSVPALPPEYVTSAAELSADDLKSLPSAREYAAECTALDRTPSVRGLMRHAKIGQDKAGRLLDYLETEETT